MEKIIIGFSYELGKANEPRVIVNLRGCEDDEDPKKVLLLIDDCLEKNFPGKVKKSKNAKKLLEGK